MGLSIVNSIMHLLAGHRLSMRSKVGSGTRFSVYVPKAASKESSYIKNLAFDADAIVDVSGLFVLYVEDDALVRSTTESLLREFGILCETSKSVGEFIAKLPKIERMPDLILTDNGLPDNFLAIDVINAATKEFDSNIPTIVLTGESQSLDSLKLLESVTIMRKPVSAAELIKTIQILCAPPARDVEKPVQGITGQ